MTFYEVEYREKQDLPDEVDRPWTRLPPQPADGEAVRLDDLAVGVAHEVRVRVVEVDGEVSDWTYLDPITPTATPRVPLSFPLGFKVECDSFLKWEFPLDRPDLKGFLVRTAIGNYQRWEDLVPCHEGIWPTPPLPLCNLPRGEPRTFAVRAVDVDGNLGPIGYAVVNRGPYDDAEPVVHEQVIHTDPFPDLTLVQGEAALGVLQGSPLTTGWHPVSERPAWSETPSVTAGWGNAWGDLVIDFHYDIPAYESARERFERVLTVLPRVQQGENWQLFYKLRDHPGWTGKPESPGWTGLPAHRGWTSWGDDAPGWGAGADPGWSADPSSPGWGKYITPWLPWPGRLKGLERQRVYFRLLVPGGRQRGQVTRVTVTTSKPTPVPTAAAPQDLATAAQVAAVPTTGRLLKTTTITTVGSGFFVPDPLTKSFEVELLGSGGGGGGANANAPPAMLAAAAGGGAAGAYLRKLVTGTLLKLYPYTIGAAGVGGGGGPGAPGGAGGATTFGSGAGLLTAPGGGGGAGSLGVAVDGFTGAGVSGLATGGDVNGLGAPGVGGMVYGGATVAVGGKGGDTFCGGGGDQVNNGPGLAAGGPGAGGGGGGCLVPAPPSPGGPGSVGIIIIREYS